MSFGISAAALAEISIAMTAVSAGVAAYGAIKQGQAQSAALQYQAQVAANNQKIANQYAQQAIADGENKVAAKQQQTAQMIGAQRAAMAANGIDLDSGSPLRLQQDTAKLGNVDALTIRNNAAREAYGYQVQGLSYGQQAQLDEAGASNAVTAGNLNAFSSIIGGASSIGSKWIDYTKTGVFS
ncbi:hypothetical protein NUJ30_08765 [Burkholderia contaminans]|jgi:hypothetical protein|uniref:hypothetical protein n=1 Tax=Burkholderia TaxID=32008 RepID=UPI0010F7421A|nr:MULTISPECIES: hypothetical protein [Burkholderia]MBD1412793.1 hypothetical protein [Burkholderia contaminans]MBM6427849.1 hypothetical protein [Burkholderia contaminans]UXZ68755.1 hypothetical protein NUJ29_08770 [Burkholderia contaminans]UXZ76516.1 hypothetical protein NUJ30_08765 [Burkholderia contaminans]